ncbi:MAG: winged helix-turn-helix transcriptional regulator [Euryarchaeota archaeon]|nr:winged helix-turn-helix transcriptional regulator [Euryarchaeota archaeon]
MAKMRAKRLARSWPLALLVLWASVAGALPDAAAQPALPAPCGAPGASPVVEVGTGTPSPIAETAVPPEYGEGGTAFGSGTQTPIAEAAAPLDDSEGGAAAGAAGRSIVVLSDSVSMTLARGTFESGLEPFEEGDAAFRVDRPLQLVGQLVDGNYTLLSHGGGRDAAERNNGVAGHGESVRWWFNGVEQSRLPVAWRPPGGAGGEINGTFFINGWVPDRGLVPSAGVYPMRFAFAGTRVSYPGLGEFQIYPPCDPPALNVTVLFPTETSARPFGSPRDAGETVTVAGSVRASDGGRPSGGVVVSGGGRTLGPALPGGLFIDEVEVSVPGIPTVVYREGFERGLPGWTAGGEGGDWEAGTPSEGPAAYRGSACLGTGLHGPYSHLADEWVDSPSIDLSDFPSEARLSFALVADLHGNDTGMVRVWNGTDWSDPVDLSGHPAGVWSLVSIDTAALEKGGRPFPVAGTSDLRLRFGLSSSTPSAQVEEGAFSLDWRVPQDASAGPCYLTFKFVPDGPYVRSWGNLKVDIRAATRFEISAPGTVRVGEGGWAEVKGRLLDFSEKPLGAPSGREGGGLLRACWDDGRGNITSDVSVAGPNATGWFACARRIAAGGLAPGASFQLRFEGSALHQAAGVTVPCTARGCPRFELEPAAAVQRGGLAYLSGCLVLGNGPVAGALVGFRFPGGNGSAVTGPEGRFSVEVPVPSDWAGTFLRVDLGFAGGESPGLGELEPAEAHVEMTVQRRLEVGFEGAPLEKGREVATVIAGERFRGLAGTVLDERGAVAPGVEVVVRALRPGGIEVLGRARTGADGVFAVPWTVDWSEPPGELRLLALASLPGSAPAQREAVFDITARTLLLLDPLPPLSPGARATVSGRLVEDRDGQPGDPVRDAALEVAFAGRAYPAVTDGTGRFSALCAVDVTSGNLSVEASFGGQGALGPSGAVGLASVQGREAGRGPLPPSTGVPVASGPAATAGSLLAVLAGVALIAGTEAGRFKLLLALVPLYSKIRKEEVLDQFVRGQVFGYIQANPGDHYSSIRQTLKLKNGTLAYHLRTLERENFVFSRMDGIFRRFYPSGLDPARVRLRGNIRETHRRILELIEGSPGITPKELAGKMGASHQVASYHVRLLARKGRIRLEQRGRNTLCFPAAGGAGGAPP